MYIFPLAKAYLIASPVIFSPVRQCLLIICLTYTNKMFDLLLNIHKIIYEKHVHNKVKDDNSFALKKGNALKKF